MAGVGMGLVHFFVRSYRIKNGEPVAYDPFWIETCLRDDGNEMAALKSRTTAKVNGCSWAPPLMTLAKPFGPVDEAERTVCVCGRTAYVVGSREFPGLGRSAHHAFRQALYALCLACPKLTLLAERADTGLVKLHPKDRLCGLFSFLQNKIAPIRRCEWFILGRSPWRGRCR